MHADSDLNPTAALAVKALRVIGKRIRIARGNPPAFYSQCTDLTLDNWDTSALPNVAIGANASDLIYEELAKDKPSMICRFGTTELATLCSATTELNLNNAIRLVSGSNLVRDIGLHQGVVNSLCKLSGFFPGDVSLGRKFVELSIADIPLIDILGVWCKQEIFFDKNLKAAQRVRFRDIEPYMHDKPWSRILKNKKVLVVHPFAETISSQYKKREHLFSNPLILPEFELKTIKAVQSIANNKTQFANWFEALHHMQDQINQTDFDIAIIGCGAYGMPLAAHCKRIGKKAIHLGGQTQLLFGIKGKRWETGHDFIKGMFNEHWVYPDEQDKPRDFKVVEGGAYW